MEIIIGGGFTEKIVGSNQNNTLDTLNFHCIRIVSECYNLKWFWIYVTQTTKIPVLCLKTERFVSQWCEDIFILRQRILAPYHRRLPTLYIKSIPLSALPAHLRFDYVYFVYTDLNPPRVMMRLCWMSFWLKSPYLPSGALRPLSLYWPVLFPINFQLHPDESTTTVCYRWA